MPLLYYSVSLRAARSLARSLARLLVHSAATAAALAAGYRTQSTPAHSAFDNLISEIPGLPGKWSALWPRGQPLRLCFSAPGARGSAAGPGKR